MKLLCILLVALGGLIVISSAVVLAASGLAAGLTGWEPVNPNAYYATMWSIMLGGVAVAVPGACIGAEL